MNVDFVKRFGGYVWLAMHGPCMSNYTLIEYIPCGYSMSTIWGFDHIEDKHSLYRGKDCLKKFCGSLREHGRSIIDFKKEKKSPLTR